MSKASDFTLFNQDGEKVSLKSLRGQKVLLYFYPKAMTSGCTVQACSLRDSMKELQKLGVVVLGVSPDAPEKLQKFIEKENLNFTLLSDPDFAVAKSFGAYGEKSLYGRKYFGMLRESFIIDEKGNIIHHLKKVKTKTHHQDILDLLLD